MSMSIKRLKIIGFLLEVEPRSKDLVSWMARVPYPPCREIELKRISNRCSDDCDG